MSFRALALSPIILPQALWVAARAARLPEASGDRTGRTGTGPALRLLILGDSSAAGVGVATQSQALSGRLADALAKDFSVEWDVLARSGGTVRSTLAMLDDLPEATYDIAIVALGVNDAKNGGSVRSWTGGYRRLIQVISERFGTTCICLSGLPPVQEFPILPRPLNRVLGDRFDLFDAALRQIAEERADVMHLPLDFSMDATKMASDGFHPGPDVYAEWAARAADMFKAALA